MTEIDPDYRTPYKECRLLMAAEGDSDENWEPVLHYYESLLKHLGWKDGGKALAGGVMKAGDIEGKPALAEAKALGAAIR